LLAEHRALAPGQQTTLALRFALEEGWHIYWQNPGDSGQPPRVRWQLPSGLEVGEVQWPVPQRIQTAANIVDYGYHGTVLLLVPLRAAASLLPGPAAIGAQLQVVVCREICVAGKADVSLTLPVRTGNAVLNPALRRAFSRARQSLPQPAPARWRIHASQSRESVVLQIETEAPVSKGFFFPWDESQIENSAPQEWEPLADGRGIRLTLRTSSRLRVPLDRLRGVLALEGGRAYFVEAPVVQQGRN
jgi:thiol:disulfide interchange protein DsbD